MTPIILLVSSNTLVSLLYPRACIHLYRYQSNLSQSNSGLCLK